MPSNSVEKGSFIRAVAAILIVVSLLAGIGMGLLILGRQLIHGGDPSLLLVVAGLAAGAVGWFLLELLGGAALELVLAPVRTVYERYVPQSTQQRLNGVVGGPWLLLAILVFGILGIVALTHWSAG